MKFRSARTFLVLAVLLPFFHSQSTFAASITVNASCSLADAITAAEQDRSSGGCTAGSGADTITLSADVTLSADLPDIAYSEITIEGGGHTISGDDNYQIFDVSSGTLTINNVTLSNGTDYEGGAIHNFGGSVTITNSTISNNSADRDGGAIFNSNYGTLNISNSTFTGNSAGWGGAILNRFSSTATISGSSFSNNSAGTDGGAVDGSHGGSVTISNSTFSSNSASWGSGGAINKGPLAALSVTGSSFSNNSARRGGAISSQGSPIDASDTTVISTSIIDSIFTGNSSTYDGGAIHHKDKVLSISSSTFKDNGAGGWGGALAMFAGLSSININNSTLSNNSASNGGGAILNRSGTVTVTHSTLNGNTADSGPGGIGSVNGGHTLVNLRNSIIAGSTGSDCEGDLDQNVGNLIEDNTCSPAVSGDPRLGTLTGSPAYYPLLSNSPAIDAGHSDYCPTTDQAGQSRPVGEACDIGAYEAQGTSTILPTATDTLIPTATDTLIPTATDTLIPTATDTLIPTATNTLVPTATNTLTPTATNTAIPLGRPTNLTASTNASGITLNWAGPAGPVDGYEILRRRPHEGEQRLQTLVADTGNTSTTYTDTTATEAGVRYVYRVKAIRNGERSNRSGSVVVDRPPPTNTPVPPPTNTPVPPPTNTQVPPPTNTPVPPPTNTQNAPKDVTGFTVDNSTGGQLTASWQAPHPAPDRYRVQWRQSGTSWQGGGAWNQRVSATTYTITGLTPGNQYEVRVRARYAGESNGDWASSITRMVGS